MQVVGLHKEELEFQVACLSEQKGQVILEFLERREGPLSISKEMLVVAGVDGHDLLIRQLRSPLRKKQALHKTLPFQLEALIPYSLDEVIVKPIYMREKEETLGTFFTVPKKFFEKFLHTYQERGVDPEWVSVVPMALLRFGEFTCPDAPSLVIFHVGKIRTQIISVKMGMIESHLTLPMGAQDFHTACTQDNCFELTHVKEKSSPHLFELLSRLRREVDRAFCFLAQKEEEESIHPVLFCGEMASQIERALLEEGAFRFSPLEIQGYRGFDAEVLRSYAISIGLCLDALKNDQKSIQLRQGEYISEPRLKKIKTGLIKGGVLAGILFALTAFCSSMYFQKKNQELSHEMESLAMEYEGEMPALKGVRLVQGAHEKMEFMDRELRLPKNRDGYFSPPPLVSDFLTFISTHPKLEGIELLRIEYELKSYPTLDRPDGVYKPKVKILFTTEEAKKARDFHDAIVEGGDLIKSDAEIEWNRKGSEYEIAFFLQV
ncbi:MAG: hypothetical protein AB7N99_09260 [Simkaniaceae bacterium]